MALAKWKLNVMMLSLGTVTLELFWKVDVAGGKSSYEVVRQAVRPRLAGTQNVDPDRRFDVTLLINGLPLKFNWN